LKPIEGWSALELEKPSIRLNLAEFGHAAGLEMDTKIKDNKASFNTGILGLLFVIATILSILFYMNSSGHQKDQRNQEPVPQVRNVHIPLRIAKSDINNLCA